MFGLEGADDAAERGDDVELVDERSATATLGSAPIDWESTRAGGGISADCDGCLLWPGEGCGDTMGEVGADDDDDTPTGVDGAGENAPCLRRTPRM